MKRKQRFIVNYSRENKENFLSMAANTDTGIFENPDFNNAPVRPTDYRAAYQAMVAAAPFAVRSNIDGLRAFKPLREIVEGMMTKLADFAQSTIGNNPERMEASGLPLTKEPVTRPDDINEEVKNPKIEPGVTVGKVNVSVKPNRAAEGIVVEERQPDMSNKEVAKVTGFKATLNGYAPDDVVVLQLRYWNNNGVGPRMGRPLAIVV